MMLAIIGCEGLDDMAETSSGLGRRAQALRDKLRKAIEQHDGPLCLFVSALEGELSEDLVDLALDKGGAVILHERGDCDGMLRGDHDRVAAWIIAHARKIRVKEVGVCGCFSGHEPTGEAEHGDVPEMVQALVEAGLDAKAISGLCAVDPFRRTSEDRDPGDDDDEDEDEDDEDDEDDEYEDEDEDEDEDAEDADGYEEDWEP